MEDINICKKLVDCNYLQNQNISLEMEGFCLMAKVKPFFYLLDTLGEDGMFSCTSNQRTT